MILSMLNKYNPLQRFFVVNNFVTVYFEVYPKIVFQKIYLSFVICVLVLNKKNWFRNCMYFIILRVKKPPLIGTMI